MTNGGMDDLIAGLGATPGWLADAFGKVSTGELEASPVQGEWNIADIIGHLRASDAILAPRIMHVLIHPGVGLIAFDERAWADVAAGGGLSIADQLTEFALRRRELVGILRSLKPEQWQLSGEHELRGTITVAQIAGTTVEHEAEHRMQVESLLMRNG